MATSTVGRIHTHLRNAVPLVWGSLRLAPTIASIVTIENAYIKSVVLF